MACTVLASLGQEALEHPLAAAPREQVAGAFFVERVGEAVGVDLGEAAREFLAGEFFEGDAEVAQDRDGVLRILVNAVAHPQRPGLEKEPVTPALARLLPDLERPDHHLGVDAIGARRWRGSAGRGGRLSGTTSRRPAGVRTPRRLRGRPVTQPGEYR